MLEDSNNDCRLFNERGEAPPRGCSRPTARAADLSTTQRYMHLSPAATEDAIRLLYGRECGVHKKFGNILDTASAGE